jgi:hypothetical protein
MTCNSMNKALGPLSQQQNDEKRSLGNDEAMNQGHVLTTLLHLVTLPDVLLTMIWHFLNTNDHLMFRSCCLYLNHQSHHRHDIGPLYSHFDIINCTNVNRFAAIARLRPYSIRYIYSGTLMQTREALLAIQAMNTVWSSITTLRQLDSGYSYTLNDEILLTQTRLTLLKMDSILYSVQYLIHLASLSVRQLRFTDFIYLPTSLTHLNVGAVPRWTWFDEGAINMVTRLRNLRSLHIGICPHREEKDMTGELQAFNRWASLQQLELTWMSYEYAHRLQGVYHTGSAYPHPPHITHSHPSINQ